MTAKHFSNACTQRQDATLRRTPRQSSLTQNKDKRYIITSTRGIVKWRKVLRKRLRSAN